VASVSSSRSFQQLAVASALTLTIGVGNAAAQAPPRDEHPHGQKGEEKAAAIGKTSARLEATLVEPEKKAKEKAATVKVSVVGVEIVDPALENEKPAPGKGHLHYQVDDDPIIATTATKLSFHELSAGKHTIKVVLAGNDHRPLGPEQTLTVTIP
jgi:hypothetical protein